MKKLVLSIFSIFFLISNSFTQTIINTESLLREIDSTFAFKLNIDGNVNFGNIEFTQLNNSLSIGKKINNSLLRLSFGYEYISEEKDVLADDWVGQVRFNKFYKKNSAFLFLQGQNVKSLKLLHRYLIGAGYRIRIKEKQTDYFDFSLGFFYEDELYKKDLNSQLGIHNYRYSFSSFSNFLINEKISLSTSVYYSSHHSPPRNGRSASEEENAVRAADTKSFLLSRGLEATRFAFRRALRYPAKAAPTAPRKSDRSRSADDGRSARTAESAATAAAVNRSRRFSRAPSNVCSSASSSNGAVRASMEARLDASKAAQRALDRRRDGVGDVERGGHGAAVGERRAARARQGHPREDSGVWHGTNPADLAPPWRVAQGVFARSCSLLTLSTQTVRLVIIFCLVRSHPLAARGHGSMRYRVTY